MGADEEDKLNLILASGQEYDLIKVPSRQLLTKYIKNNAIQPLSDLINQYGDNLQKYIRPETWDMVTSNGEIYAIPEEAVADVEWGIGVREDWVNALGMELPTTPDEFYELLKAFKEQDPGNEVWTRRALSASTDWPRRSALRQTPARISLNWTESSSPASKRPA